MTRCPYCGSSKGHRSGCRTITELTDTYTCESGAEIVFIRTGDDKYTTRLAIRSSTGEASLTERDMDDLAYIFRKGGPAFL